MPSRRKHNSARFAAELGLAGMHTFMTLCYRLPILATHGKPGAEIGRMVSEKAAAMIEGMWDAQVEALHIAGKAATGQLHPTELAVLPAQIAAAGLRPALRRVKANSQRLHRRSRRA